MVGKPGKEDLMTDDNWAIVRQVVIAAEDLDATSTLLKETLGLAPGFRDPISVWRTRRSGSAPKHTSKLLCL